MTCPGRAPNATRIPISRCRWCTASATTPYNPIDASSRASRPPLDAIAARFRPESARRPVERFTAAERAALDVLGLKPSVDRTALRQRYSDLVRRFHPDRNGGDRSHESKLRAVIDAYQRLKGSRAFA